MNAKELRVGNLIKIVKSDYASEVSQDVLDVCGETIMLIQKKDITVEPIPLTEEWLLRFDIYNLNSIGVYGGDIWVDIKHSLVGISGDDACTSGQSFYARCEYVHQLQNIYFALTGEELELKPESK